MRPQHITAENPLYEQAAAAGDLASMRPQHITAENPSAAAWSSACAAGFNEAAAYHCGKPELHAEKGTPAAWLQ